MKGAPCRRGSLTTARGVAWTRGAWCMGLRVEVETSAAQDAGSRRLNNAAGQGPLPGLRAAALKAKDPAAGIAPGNLVTGGEGACGLLVEAVVDASLRQPGIRDDVLGKETASEAAVEADRR